MSFDRENLQAVESTQQAFVQMEDTFNQLDPYSPYYIHYFRMAEEELREVAQLLDQTYSLVPQYQKHQLDQISRKLQVRKQELME